MHIRSRLALQMAFLGTAVLTPLAGFAALPTCAELATNHLYGLAGNPLVTASASDNQGLVSPSAAIVAATATDSAYCLVHLQYSSKSGPADGYAPGESQTIGINVSLPLNSTDGGTPKNPNGYSWSAVNGAWNGKVENMGGGGFAGSLGSTTGATDAGYVGSITDGGHNSAQNGNDGDFGVIQASHELDIGKIIDFQSESLHQQYRWSLALAQSYYGRPAERNYWFGCSTGGRQGLELAQKWGEDFDGFVVGAAVVYWDDFDLSGKGWPPLMNRDDVVGAGHPAITTAQYQNAVSHAIAACDVEGTDTVKDGVVDDPRQCTYTTESDPSILSGAGGTCTGTSCLDAVQAKAIDSMWENGVLDGGPHNHHGKKTWYGLMQTILSPSGGVGPAIGTGGTNPERQYRWDHRDLTADVENIYSTRALAAANPLGKAEPTALEDEQELNQSPTGPGQYWQNDDYQGVIDHVHKGPKHGKIIHWSGANDQNVFMPAQIRFYRSTATAFGHGEADYDGLSSWYRYYHAPGVGHCGGNVGASPTLANAPDGQAQMFTDMVNWVEKGVEPQSAGDSTHRGILAAGPGTFGTRPICPYPQTAIYNGSGSTSVASNYHCGGNLDTKRSLCQLAITPFDRVTSNQLNYREVGVDPAACQAHHEEGDDHGGDGHDE
jgi:hypothetical protein